MSNAFKSRAIFLPGLLHRRGYSQVSGKSPSPAGRDRIGIDARTRGPLAVDLSDRGNLEDPVISATEAEWICLSCSFSPRIIVQRYGLAVYKASEKLISRRARRF